MKKRYMIDPFDRLNPGDIIVVTKHDCSHNYELNVEQKILKIIERDTSSVRLVTDRTNSKNNSNYLPYDCFYIISNSISDLLLCIENTTLTNEDVKIIIKSLINKVNGK